jgi:hypothetical protein
VGTVGPYPDFKVGPLADFIVANVTVADFKEALEDFLLDTVADFKVALEDFLLDRTLVSRSSLTAYAATTNAKRRERDAFMFNLFRKNVKYVIGLVVYL